MHCTLARERRLAAACQLSYQEGNWPIDIGKVVLHGDGLPQNVHWQLSHRTVEMSGTLAPSFVL